MNYIPRQMQGLVSTALGRIKRIGGPTLALPPPLTADELIRLCDVLLARRGQAWATATAGQVFNGYARAAQEHRNRFLSILGQRYGADSARLDKAIAAYARQRDAAGMAEIHAASESLRHQLLHELNQAQGGTLMLLKMREDGLAHKAAIPAFEALDADFRQVLASWFNRGFLVLRRIDWSSPASVLRKIIEYEAVHEIRDWDDLQRRVEPADRRCYAFFHPQIPEEPLIFVEVALTSDIPSSIQALLDENRAVAAAAPPTTAVFYSISNCQDGLRGVPFGNFLIKQAAEILKAELPSLKTFVTLSPMPTFASWLARERKAAQSTFIQPSEVAALAALDQSGWEHAGGIRETLMSIAARFLLNARSKDQRPSDSVARFHLGNGAELAHIHWMADTSSKGLRESYGLMVNYLYDLRHIEQNQAALAQGDVAASAAIHKLARVDAPGHAGFLNFWRSPAAEPAETD